MLRLLLLWLTSADLPFSHVYGREPWMVRVAQQIEPDGTVLVQDTASGSNARALTSLDGATYSLG
jgi:hypothetical protein